MDEEEQETLRKSTAEKKMSYKLHPHHLDPVWRGNVKLLGETCPWTNDYGQENGMC